MADPKAPVDWDKAVAQFGGTVSNMPLPSHAPASPGPTLTERALDLLPMAGGIAGGAIGGAGGTVAGMGVGGVPGAIGGAALGGAGGEAAKQLIQIALQLMGAPGGGAPPQTSGDAALNIAKQAGLQGGSEVGGQALTGAARALGKFAMRQAIRPSVGLTQEFPDIVDTALKERVPVGPVFRGGGKKGSDLAKQKLLESSSELRALLSKAESDGARFTPDQVLNPVLDLIDDIAKEPLPEDNERHLYDMISEFLRRHPGPLTPNDVKDLKQTAGQIAHPIMKARARGEYMPAAHAIYGRFNEAVEQGGRKALEDAIPGVGKVEGRTQRLIGLTSAVQKAEARTGSLDTAGMSGAIAGAVMNPSGTITSKAAKAIIGYMVGHGMATPEALSNGALFLTNKQVQLLIKRFPQLGQVIVQQGAMSSH